MWWIAKIVKSCFDNNNLLNPSNAKHQTHSRSLVLLQFQFCENVVISSKIVINTQGLDAFPAENRLDTIAFLPRTQVQWLGMKAN